MATVDPIAEQPVLPLFLVIGVGSAVGRVRVRGVVVAPVTELHAASALLGDSETQLTDIDFVALLVLRWTVGRISHFEGPAASGAVAGLQTQPAVLAFADSSSSHSPQVPLGYTALYPAAMVAKIVLAQLLVRL